MRDPELREPTCIGSMVDAELVEIGGAKSNRARGRKMERATISRVRGETVGVGKRGEGGVWACV